MIIAWVLFVVIMIHHYLPNIPILVNFINTRGTNWLVTYLELVQRIFSKRVFFKGEIVALLAILLVVILTYSIEFLLQLLLGDLGRMIFMMAILYYCLESRIETAMPESILIKAHEQIFGILFWFASFGAEGAIGYWLLTNIKTLLTSAPITISGLVQGINIMHGCAAWLPARLTGLLYALVGDFVEGFSCWQLCVRTVAMPSSKVLVDCGQAALNVVSTAEEQALVERTTIAWVILGMLLALIIAEVIIG